MNQYDKEYMKIAKSIKERGYLDNNRTGTETLKLPHQIMQFDLEKEFPILQTKQVFIRTAIKELLWIFKEQSNDVKKLQEQGVKIWNEWMMEDGTIGTSYGWIVKEFNQIDNLINTLKTNPQDRRMMINLWQIPYLDTGALHPCCFLSMWDVTDGRLNCMLIQRSGDIPLGVPFNTSQYAILVHMIAQVTGLKPGLFTHVINNAHIYLNQIEGMKEQIVRYDYLDKISRGDVKSEIPTEYLEILNSTPKLKLNPNITNFYDFTVDDIEIEDYKYLKPIKMPVSV